MFVLRVFVLRVFILFSLLLPRWARSAFETDASIRYQTAN